MAAYVLDDFERPDVGDLGLDELPERGLLTAHAVAQRARVAHDVRPVLLQAVQG